MNKNNINDNAVGAYGNSDANMLPLLTNCQLCGSMWFLYQCCY